MHDLLQELPCIYFSSSSEGVITDVNVTLTRFLGYERDELVGQKLELIFTLSTRIFQQTHLNPLLKLNGTAEEIYITLQTKVGEELPMLVNARRIEGDGGLYHCIYAGISVSKRKKFEDEIIAAKNQAEAALRENSELKAAQEELRRRAEELDWQIEITIQQNRELMQFNHLATHTLQEPVRKMLFLSDRLTTQDNWKKTEMAVRKIRDLTTDMNEKLKGLQKYAWFSNDGFESERIAIQDLFLIAKEELETQNPELSLRIACQPLPEIEANRAQMFFLVKELLLNAVKFRRPGNLVDVKIVASQLLMNKYRQLTGKYKYIECVKFQISDDGRGFDGTYQEQAFELFRQLHSASGNGVGLSLCKKIVENHGGSIHLESEPEAGTSVVIFLPLIQKKKDLSKNQLICTTSRISLCSEQKKSVDEIQYF